MPRIRAFSPTKKRLHLFQRETTPVGRIKATAAGKSVRGAGEMRKKTAQFIEEQKVSNSTVPKRKRGRGPDRKPRKVSPKSLANLQGEKYRWPKGVSGNPSGMPGTDVAALIARRVIEGNQEETIAGFAKQLRGGNAYAFSVLADRGYGKVTQTVEVTGSIEIIKRLEAARKRAGGS